MQVEAVLPQVDTNERDFVDHDGFPKKSLPSLPLSRDRADHLINPAKPSSLASGSRGAVAHRPASPIVRSGRFRLGALQNPTSLISINQLDIEATTRIAERDQVVVERLSGSGVRQDTQALLYEFCQLC